MSRVARREQGGQERVQGGCKRVGHGHAAPREPVLEILGQEQTTVGVCRRRQHDRVPDAETVMAARSAALTITVADVSTVS